MYSHSWLLLAFIVGAIGFQWFGAKRVQELPSPKRELCLLRNSVLVAIAAAWFLYFLAPNFAYYVRSVDGSADINEIRVAVSTQAEALHKLIDDVGEFRDLVTILGLVAATSVFGFFLRFATVVANEPLEQHPEPPMVSLNLGKDDPEI